MDGTSLSELDSLAHATLARPPAHPPVSPLRRNAIVASSAPLSRSELDFLCNSIAIPENSIHTPNHAAGLQTAFIGRSPVFTKHQNSPALFRPSAINGSRLRGCQLLIPKTSTRYPHLRCHATGRYTEVWHGIASWSTSLHHIQDSSREQAFPGAQIEFYRGIRIV